MQPCQIVSLEALLVVQYLETSGYIFRNRFFDNSQLVNLYFVVIFTRLKEVPVLLYIDEVRSIYDSLVVIDCPVDDSDLVMYTLNGLG